MTDPNTLGLAAEALEKAAEAAPEDQAREHLIKAHGLRMQVARDRADAGAEFFHFRGEADRHRLAMEALIRQRPADFVGELPVLRRVAGMTGWLNRCHFGDCLEVLRGMPDGIAHTCVTSPPYFGLRDYGHDGQIGLEASPDAFVAKLVDVFREVRRVLRDDGTVWLNLGDSYAGSWGNAGGHNRGNGTQREITVGSVVKDQAERNGDFVPPAANGYAELGIKKKDLIGIPWRVAFALQADGWYLRQEIIWAKPNPMPESVTDRCTKSHEQIFLLAKSASYYCDMEAIAEQSMGRELFGNSRSKGSCEQRQDNDRQDMTPTETRNKRSVWTVSTKPYKGAHFATFPPDLIEPCVLAGAPAGGVVLDPFFGSGTTGQVAQALGRQFIGIEINPSYKPLQDERLSQPSLILEAA